MAIFTMRGMKSFFFGTIAGFLFVPILTWSLFYNIDHSYRKPEDLQFLRWNADRWESVRPPVKGECTAVRVLPEGKVAVTFGEEGFFWNASSGAWEAGKLDTPQYVYRDSGSAAVHWFLVDGNESLSAWEGDCALHLEPSQEKLPAFPGCPGDISRRMVAATRSDAGDTLVVVYDPSVDRHRAFRLLAGSTAWKDLGVLDVPTNSGTLVKGTGDRVLYISAGGRLLLFSGDAWRLLPEHSDHRYAQFAALLADGSVFAGGGQIDGDPTAYAVLFGFPLLALIVIAIAMRHAASRRQFRYGPMILGVLLAAVTGGLAVYVVMLMSIPH